MRIEAREVDLEEKEEKVRTEVEWVDRSDEDLKRREKAVEEAGRAAAEVKANAERVAKEAEQRFLEIESRERALREEAAHEAIELTKHTEALKQVESDLTARQADFEKERAARTLRLQGTETDLQARARTLDANAQGVAERDTPIGSREESFAHGTQSLQEDST